MRRAILVLIFLLVTGGVAWAGTAAYKLVMSKDKELCAGMLNLFNTDMEQYRQIRYETHEVFTEVPWQSVDLGEKPDGCAFLWRAIFDVNNDGKEDLVIRTSLCLRDQLSDGLYIFPSDSDVLSRLKPGKGGWAPLFNTPNKFARTGHIYSLMDVAPPKEDGYHAAIGGVFTLQPFVWSKATYVSMTDLDQEWIVIAKYKQAETLEDICYFHGPSLIAQ